MSRQTEIIANQSDSTFSVIRDFDAPMAIVWRAYTEAVYLDQWWGPQPWRAETKEMDFRVGGHWLYAMCGPEGERHWGRMDYTDISLHQFFAMKDCFCDEHGVANPALPESHGRISFHQHESCTRVEWKTTYASAEGLQTVVAMGMEQGVRICVDQLVALLASGTIV